MKEKSKRKLISLTMFDVVRGIAIIFVLARHSIHVNIDDSLFWKMCCTILMPVFFIISGYWLKKRSLKDGVVSTFKSCLVPYVVVMGLIDIVGLIHRLIIHNFPEWVQLFLVPSIFVWSGENSRIGAMWFVFSLVIGWIIIYVLLQIQDDRLRGVSSVLICFAGTLLLPYKLPFQIAQGMCAQLFLYVGYRMKKRKLLEKNLAVPVGIALAAIWLIGGYFCTLNARCDFAFYLWGNGFPAIVCSICGSFLVIYFGIRWTRAENWLTEKLGRLGRYTFWILCIHSFEGAVVPWKYLFKLVPEESVAGTLAQLILRSVFIYCGCVIIKNLQIRRNQYVAENH